MLAAAGLRYWQAQRVQLPEGSGAATMAASRATMCWCRARLPAKLARAQWRENGETVASAGQVLAELDDSQISRQSRPGRSAFMRVAACRPATESRPNNKLPLERWPQRAPLVKARCRRPASGRARRRTL